MPRYAKFAATRLIEFERSAKLPTMPPAEETDDELTGLLRAWRGGDPAADERLLERVQATLKRIAASQLRAERSGHTLQPTALVHEAYLRLVGQRELDWRDRSHFFGLAAVTMRRILVDHARRRRAKKRGAGDEPLPLTLAGPAGETVDLLDLDRALVRFAERFPRPAKVVEMRYFTGLEFAEVARALEISEITAKRDWAFARAWLRRALDGDPNPSA
jgi:RNA polymerase sigma factor (TIGR02999 family)